jgi:hypothetical protein
MFFLKWLKIRVLLGCCRITSYSTGGFYTIKEFQDQFEFHLTEVMVENYMFFGEEIAIAAERKF